MHIPSKHKVETVEEAMREAAEYQAKQPSVKIVVNVGSTHPPMKHHGSSAPLKKGPKKRKMEKHKGLPGPMENALKSAY